MWRSGYIGNWQKTLFLLFLGLGWAQIANTRSLRVIIQDAQTQEALAGAIVVPLVEGIPGTLSDTLGVAELRLPLSEDTLWIEIRYLGYQTLRLPLTGKSSVLLRVRLKPEGIEQEEVVIAGLQNLRTEVSLLAALAQMAQIVSGLSAQTIQRTPDRSAAAVLSRVTGVSLQDGRFLVIRGMNERYNPVILNRLPAPSTEPDSRGFDLEILPADLIDQVRVYKTPTASQTGDFGGGLVEILTRRSSDKPSFHLQLRTSYLHGTTFRPGYGNILHAGDWWGAGVSARALPSGFPENFTDLPSSEAQRWTEALPQTFQLREKTTIPPAAQLATAIGIPLTQNLWMITGLSYERSFRTLDIERNRYEMRVLTPGANAKLFAYRDHQTTEMLRFLGFTNVLWAPAAGQQLEVNLFAARLTEDETIVREGFSLYQRGNDALFRNYSMQYLARTLASGQLGGTHRLGTTTALRWDIGGTATLRDEPDYRRVRTVKEEGDSLFRIILPPGPTTFDAARFYSQLRQYGINTQISLLAELGRWKFISGLQGEFVNRSFWARWFSYTLPATTSPTFIQAWSALPIEEAFSQEYLSRLRLREGTNPNDRYKAQQLVVAPFLSIDRSWSRLALQVGLRYEYGQQRLQSATSTAPLDIVTPFPLLMPFLSGSYMLNPTHRIRAGYSRTLNRPTLREIAPFLYYNFALEVQQAGNAALRPASLHNLDLRYEIAPSLDQLIAFGAFYKYVRNPIETYILRGADQPTVRFGNANSVQLTGIELELRLNLTRHISTITNAAYIWSQVDMGEAVYGTGSAAGPSQARLRPLQGQAPYLFNMLIVYSHAGWEIASAGQLFGPRLWWVGDNFNPSIFEMPRPVWDAHLRKQLGTRGFYIKLQARDILNTPFLYLQDTNLNGRISRNEDVIFRFVRGSEWSLTLGWQPK